MKKLLSIVISCAIALSMTTAYAEVNEIDETENLNFRGYSWSGEISETTPKKLLITDNVVITQDVKITDKDIRVEDNGILEIADGAQLTLENTKIFIENGGTLIISNGELNILGINSSVKNIGTMIVASNGKLNIKSGGFSYTAESSFICGGKISCVSEKHFNKAISTIKRYDKNFNYTDYTMYVYASGPSSATVQFKYCIDQIETNYKYTATISQKNGCKVTRSSIKLSNVYNEQLHNELRDKVFTYEALNNLPDSYNTGIRRENYYLYNFSKNTLLNEYVYYKLEFDTDAYFVYDIVETTELK